MAHRRSSKTEEAFNAAAPICADAGEIAKLFAARNQAFIHFYFERMHQHQAFYTKMVDDYSAQVDKFFKLSTGGHPSLEAEDTLEEAAQDYEASLLAAQADAAKIIEQAKAQAERIIEGAYTRSDSAKQAAAQNGRAPARRKSA